MAQRLVVPVLLLLAALPRLVGLGHPSQLMFDEQHYARDACTYLSTDGCGIEEEENLQHPPLGKWLIAAGIAAFGNDAFGWRIASALAGTVSVLLLYMVARRAGATPSVAVLAGALMALDPLHLVQSRIAMLDIFVVTFGLAALLCALNAHGSSHGARWWLAGLALAGGAATATKWSGLVFLLMGLGIWLLADRALGNPSILVAGVVLLAFLAYATTFIGRLDGPWATTFLERQADMWSFHSGLDYQHPYASPPWAWLLLQRPVAYLFGTTSDGRVAEVLATGNPLLWWPALGAVAFAVMTWIRSKVTPIARLAVVGFAATFGMWLVFTPGRSAMFLFYMTPVLPFMYLALADLLARWRWAPLTAVVLSVASLVFLWPVLTGEPIDRGAWHRRILFEDCEARGRTAEEIATPLVHASPGGGAPPEGWCWI